MLPMLSICNPDPTALCWHITHCSTEHHTPLLLSNRATPPSFPTCPSHRAHMPRYTTVAHEAAALWFLLPAHHAACLYVHVLHLGISHSHMAEVSISHPPCCPLSKSISLLKSFSQQLNKTPGVPLPLSLYSQAKNTSRTLLNAAHTWQVWKDPLYHHITPKSLMLHNMSDCRRLRKVPEREHWKVQNRCGERGAEILFSQVWTISRKQAITGHWPNQGFVLAVFTVLQAKCFHNTTSKRHLRDSLHTENTSAGALTLGFARRTAAIESPLKHASLSVCPEGMKPCES